MRAFLLVLLMFYCAQLPAIEEMGELTGDIVPSLPIWVVVIMFGISHSLEYLVGKTTIIKPNSLFDILIQSAIKIIKVFFPSDK
jgi:hypothetical protein